MYNKEQIKIMITIIGIFLGGNLFLDIADDYSYFHRKY